MRVVKWFLAVVGGMFLFLCGMYALDVPPGLSFLRYAAGIGFMAAAVTVWDKWA